MAENNPYQPPSANVDNPQSGAGELVGPRGVGFGRGWSWIAAAFSVFGNSWLIWIVNMIILFVIMMVLSFIPIIGSLATSILSPMFAGGLMLGCRAIDDGGKLEVSHLFAGFSRHAGTLAGVGALYLLGMIVVVVIALVPMFLLGIDMGTLEGEMGPEPGPEMLLPVLLILALLIPLIMAYWFAPALVVLHDKGAIESMKLSFKGCLRNILPFLLYGIVALILLVVAAIPLGLGLLVMFPVLIASVYTGYKDIYLAQE